MLVNNIQHSSKFFGRSYSIGLILPFFYMFFSTKTLFPIFWSEILPVWEPVRSILKFSEVLSSFLLPVIIKLPIN